MPRVVEPPEDHAEHCWAVAVYSALLADDLDADPGKAFLLGLAHHLHKAALPNAGFAGEVLLGDALDPLLERLTERELATLPDALAGRCGACSRCGPTPTAFHATDVLDRVHQDRYHARAAAITAGCLICNTTWKGTEAVELLPSARCSASRSCSSGACRAWRTCSPSTPSSS